MTAGFFVIVSANHSASCDFKENRSREKVINLLYSSIIFNNFSQLLKDMAFENSIKRFIIAPNLGFFNYYK